MINFKLSSKAFNEEKSQAYAVFCQEETVITDPAICKLESHFYKPLKILIEEQKFEAKSGSSLLVSTEKDGKPVYLIILGLGKLSELSKEDKAENFRKAVGKLVRLAQKNKISKLILNLDNIDYFTANIKYLIREAVIVGDLTDYHFDKFLSKPKHKDFETELTFCVPKVSEGECEATLILGDQIGDAVNKTRHWCDLPGNFISPKTFADEAEVVAASHRLKIKIFGKEDIIKMGMGGIHNVSKGSCEDPKFVIMEYETQAKDAQTIAIVGKGITFDSGGLSIKPTAGLGGMERMKEDMAGGAAIMGTMQAIGHIKPDVNVIALIPLAENMPSGSAMRPGDVIKFYNGKTAEIKNTDAEGRLVLADALAYAVKNYKLDAIIDLATLTGGCLYSLGYFFAALLTKNEKLSAQIISAANKSGDRVWALPMYDDYKPAIKSDIADISNTGSKRYLAGTITAAFFLENFVKDIPWAHIDIAGTASNVPDRSYFDSGATGFGVRLLVDLIKNWKSL